MDSTANFFQVVLALAFVVGLMWMLGYLMRRYGERLGLPITMPTGKNRRLQLVEVLPLDANNKIVIFRRDNTQHVVLVGAESATLLEQNIPAQTLPETK